MDRDTAKAHVREQLEEYLQRRGIDTRKAFRCLNPNHEDRHPSMSLDRKRNKCHCFACAADYDTFDVIGIEYGLTEPKAIFAKAYELFGIQIDPPQRPGKRDGRNAAGTKSRSTPKRSAHGDLPAQGCAQRQENEPPAAIQAAKTEDCTPARRPVIQAGDAPGEEVSFRRVIQAREGDLEAYFQASQARIAQTRYPLERGLSPEIISRFRLGYDPNYRQGTGGQPWKALILPTGPDSFVARNTDRQAGKKDRYRKTGESRIYNREALQTAQTPIFVVEGELDALSILTAGGEAVALGSTANYRRFLRLVEQEPPAQPLLVALDNDREGQKTAGLLLEGLQQAGIPACLYNPYGQDKDAGDALVRDREGLKAAVARAPQVFRQQTPPPELGEYVRTAQAYDFLQRSFIDGIVKSIDTPCQSTGFPRLDQALDGGLYEGLYILGAISSLGKTTFVTQIADQIAQTGGEVLIFSLEMPKAELLAKSISRHTLKAVLSRENQSLPESSPERLSLADAKTSRGITDARRYASYRQAEYRLIRDSMCAYGRYAERIYIREGVGDIGAAEVREAVGNHIRLTGSHPVVVVDYLQILAPFNDRATDKQNVDRAVLELKRISRDFKIPVLVISSFNRGNYREAVSMESFKESGAIEYSSDVLIGLQLRGAGESGFDPTEAKQRNPRDVEAVVLKNRNGPVGARIRFRYYPVFNFFAED